MARIFIDGRPRMMTTHMSDPHSTSGGGGTAHATSLPGTATHDLSADHFADRAPPAPAPVVVHSPTSTLVPAGAVSAYVARHDGESTEPFESLYSLNDTDGKSLGLLGEGGEAKVYRARDLRTEEIVAVRFADGIRANDRSGREVLALRRVRSPHVVELLAHFLSPDHRGRAEFKNLTTVCRLVPGTSLAAAVSPSTRKDLPYPVNETLAWSILSQAKIALAALADASVVHGDIKPGNIMITPRTDGSVHVTLIDFGLAKVIDYRTLVTASRSGFSHFFAAPELLAEPVPSMTPPPDPRTMYADRYSLGATLVALIAGETPQFKSPRDLLTEMRQPKGAAWSAELLDAIAVLLADTPSKRMWPARLQPDHAAQNAEVQRLQRELEAVRTEIVRERGHGTRRGFLAGFLVTAAAVGSVPLAKWLVPSKPDPDPPPRDATPTPLKPAPTLDRSIDTVEKLRDFLHQQTTGNMAREWKETARLLTALYNEYHAYYLADARTRNIIHEASDLWRLLEPFSDIPAEQKAWAFMRWLVVSSPSDWRDLMRSPVDWASYFFQAVRIGVEVDGDAFLSSHDFSRFAVDYYAALDRSANHTNTERLLDLLGVAQQQRMENDGTWFAPAVRAMLQTLLDRRYALGSESLLRRWYQMPYMTGVLFVQIGAQCVASGNKVGFIPLSILSTIAEFLDSTKDADRSKAYDRFDYLLLSNLDDFMAQSPTADELRKYLQLSPTAPLNLRWQAMHGGTIRTAADFLALVQIGDRERAANPTCEEQLRAFVRQQLEAFAQLKPSKNQVDFLISIIQADEKFATEIRQVVEKFQEKKAGEQ